jgi:thiol-disulfide isomerase/thioredoxin
VCSNGGDDEELQLWLVYVFADYCNACEKLAPVWEEAVKQLKGAVRFGRVQSDFESGLARKLGASSGVGRCRTACLAFAARVTMDVAHARRLGWLQASALCRCSWW